MAMTKKKCIACIVLQEKSTPALSYSGLWRNVRLNHEEHMQFFFCANDIVRCVKGSRRKWIIPYSDTLERPPIPTIWLVKIGTNLTHSKIEALENVGFNCLKENVSFQVNYLAIQLYLWISLLFKC